METNHWFHGTPHDFDAFDPATLGKGTDQLGSGFYFTSEESTAGGYAEGGYVMVVALSLEKPMPADARFTRGQIEAILRAAPSFEESIGNWGEIAFEGERTVVGRAVNAYAEMGEGSDDAVQVLNAISNDMWQGHEAAFLRAVNEVTGYDGLIRKSGQETHAVAWLPERISVVERRARQPVAARGM